MSPQNVMLLTVSLRLKSEAELSVELLSQALQSQVKHRLSLEAIIRTLPEGDLKSKLLALRGKVVKDAEAIHRKYRVVD